MGVFSDLFSGIASEVGLGNYKYYMDNSAITLYIEDIERYGFPDWALGLAILKNKKTEVKNAIIHFYDRQGYSGTLGGERNPKKEDFNIDLPKSWLPYTNGITNLSQLGTYHIDGLRAFLIIDAESIAKFLNECKLFPKNELLQSFNYNNIVSKIYEQISQSLIKYYISSSYDYSEDYEISKNELIIFDKQGITIKNVSNLSLNNKDDVDFSFDKLGLNNLPNDDYLVAFVSSIMDKLNNVGVCSDPNYSWSLSHILEANRGFRIKKDLYNDENIIVKPICYNGYTFGEKSAHKIFVKAETTPLLVKNNRNETCIFLYLRYKEAYFNYEKKRLPEKQDWF